MHISEIYEKGEAVLREKDYWILMEGVETGFVLENNRRVFQKYVFRQKCIDAQEANTACTALGVDLSAPIIMSALTMPIPAIRKDGLLEVARGLKEAGSLMWTGTPVPKDLKALVKTGVPLASTVKPFKDRKIVYQALDEIQEAGVTWAGLEIDVGWGTKIRDQAMVSDCEPLSFREIGELRKRVTVPFILKGVLSREDALKALDAGADGIVVSNHGAHTLDYLPHPLQVLDEIMETVKGRITVMADGGFRRGSDVLKGLALGPSLIGLGRPILYALAADGKDGVRDLVQQMTAELKRIMGMIGAAAPDNINREMLMAIG
jgi:isopentenyl diphosphate isomerase/L-lactate dehydrogenase-like FMN-dependent dehydrogenase